MLRNLDESKVKLNKRKLFERVDQKLKEFNKN